MTPIVSTLAADLRLLSGSHSSADKGMCVMEAVAYVAGEPHSDTPVCACPVIGAFLRSWNDSLPTDDDRTRLLAPLVDRLVDSKSTPDVEMKRSYMAFDWLARVQGPAWMDLSLSLISHAAAIRALSPLTDKDSVVAVALPILAAAWAAARAAAWAAAGADAAWAAAGADTARSAAWAAARAAAWAAAGADTARAAAWAAAGADAARAAAGAAAGAAAWDAINPTVATLQVSALDLIDRMLEAR